MPAHRRHVQRPWIGLALLAGLAAAGLALPGSAQADSIDGAWCFTDGRYLEINGPRIRTPAGRRIAGDYGRHDFAYTVPAGEPGAGQVVNMVLLDEYTVQFRQGDPGRAPVRILKRCNPHTS